MKCDRCRKQVDKVTEILCHGKNGYRRYKLCDKCVEETKKEMEG